MRFRFIDAEKHNYSLAMLCRMMQVSRGGYYAWRDRKPSAQSQRDAELLAKIRAFYQASGKRYGSPDKARRELGFVVEVDLREGLARTVEWTRCSLSLIEACIQKHAPHMNA